MSPLPEQPPNLLETWKDSSARLRISLSGSGISFVMEAVIVHLDFYNLELAGTDCRSRIKLEHAQTFFDQAGQVEILLTSGDKIRLRQAG